MKHLQSQWQAFKGLINRYKELQSNVQKLNQAVPECVKAIHAIERSVQRFNYQNQAPLEKLSHQNNH